MLKSLKNSLGIRIQLHLNILAFSAHLSVLAVLRNSRTVIGFFWMLYWVKRPDWPVTTCWIGAGITRSSMSSYVRRGFQSFGGTTCNRQTQQWAVQTSTHNTKRDSHSNFSWMKILFNKERLTFAIPALWAPCDSIYAMYLLKSLNSSFVGWKVMILMAGLWELWETESEAILSLGL